MPPTLHRLLTWLAQLACVAGYFDVLAGEVPGPAGHVEDQRLRARRLDEDVGDGGEPPPDPGRGHDQSPQ